MKPSLSSVSASASTTTPDQDQSGKGVAESTRTKKLPAGKDGGDQNKNSQKQRKSRRKPIFISYSPEAGFVERKFVVELVQQLKENNLSEDLWFDIDENIVDNALWFSARMEAVEKCKAAILILSESYITCPVSVFELRTLLERKKCNNSSVNIFLVKYSELKKVEYPQEIFNHLDNRHLVDLTKSPIDRLSPAEKISTVIGSMVQSLEQYAAVLTAHSPAISTEKSFTGQYKRKKISQWSFSDIQEWLCCLGVKEFYRQSLEEHRVDGHLLMSLTDQDMSDILGIDSRVVRKKLMQTILTTLDEEHKLKENWHLRARAQRSSASTVYLVYDPQDARLAQSMKDKLNKTGLKVVHHGKLGQTKEDFIELNGATISTASHVLVLLTDGAATSPFVFQETMFSDWLGKKMVTIVFKNSWISLRSSLKAVLGDRPSIDFETTLFSEAMEILQHHIKPQRSPPGVVLEQAYLNKMIIGLAPLRLLVSTKREGRIT